MPLATDVEKQSLVKGARLEKATRSLPYLLLPKHQIAFSKSKSAFIFFFQFQHVLLLHDVISMML